MEELACREEERLPLGDARDSVQLFSQLLAGASSGRLCALWVAQTRAAPDEIISRRSWRLASERGLRLELVLPFGSKHCRCLGADSLCFKSEPPTRRPDRPVWRPMGRQRRSINQLIARELDTAGEWRHLALQLLLGRRLATAARE